MTLHQSESTYPLNFKPYLYKNKKLNIIIDTYSNGLQFGYKAKTLSKFHEYIIQMSRDIVMSDLKQHNIHIKISYGPLYSHLIRFTSSPFTGAATTAAFLPRNPLNYIRHVFSRSNLRRSRMKDITSHYLCND